MTALRFIFPLLHEKYPTFHSFIKKNKVCPQEPLSVFGLLGFNFCAPPSQRRLVAVQAIRRQGKIKVRLNTKNGISLLHVEIQLLDSTGVQKFHC